MIPALGINTASCGKKLLWISERFQRDFIDKSARSGLSVVQFTRKQVLLVFFAHSFSRYFRPLFADFSFNRITTVRKNELRLIFAKQNPCMLAISCLTVTPKNQPTMNENSEKRGQKAD